MFRGWECEHENALSSEGLLAWSMDLDVWSRHGLLYLALYSAQVRHEGGTLWPFFLFFSFFSLLPG